MSKEKVLDAVWRAAKEDYEAGHTVPDICRKYGLLDSTLRKRSKREGWVALPVSSLPTVAPGAVADPLVAAKEQLGAIFTAAKVLAAKIEALARGDTTSPAEAARLAEALKDLADPSLRLIEAQARKETTSLPLFALVGISEGEVVEIEGKSPGGPSETHQKCTSSETSKLVDGD